MGVKRGVDASYTSEEVFEYLVISVATVYKTRSPALQGEYFGIKADASLGGGETAGLCVGSFGKSSTLQPVAIGATKGYGATLGFGYLYLQREHAK